MPKKIKVKKVKEGTKAFNPKKCRTIQTVRGVGKRAYYKVPNGEGGFHYFDVATKRKLKKLNPDIHVIPLRGELPELEFDESGASFNLDLFEEPIFVHDEDVPEKDPHPGIHMIYEEPLAGTPSNARIVY